MNVASYLEALRHRDIEVWAEGEKLRCKGPPGTLDPALRAELQQRKADIVHFLSATQALLGQPAAIIPLQASGSLPPIFAVPGHSGDVFCFRALARHLGGDQPFFGLQPPGLDGRSPPLDSVTALAAHFAAQVLAFRPGGPYVIAGYCAGGTVAFELAQQLVQRGATIRCVALFGSPAPGWYRFLPQLQVRLAEQLARLAKHLRALSGLSGRELRGYIAAKQQARQGRLDAERQAAENPQRANRNAVEESTLRAVRRYRPMPFAGRIVVFLPNESWCQSRGGLLCWPAGLAQVREEHCGPAACDGVSMLLEPHAAAFANLFRGATAEII